MSSDRRKLVRIGLRALGAAHVVLCLAGLPAVARAQTCETRLYWDPNTETDLAGYVLWQGASTGAYSQSYPVPKDAVTYTLTLPSGTYYFALRAFNTGGLYSGYSNEVQVTLNCAPVGGRRPPTVVAGLVVVVIVRGTL